MSRDKYGTGQDPYCYPNSDILINSLNIHDEALLEEAERDISKGNTRFCSQGEIVNIL